MFYPGDRLVAKREKLQPKRMVILAVCYKSYLVRYAGCKEKRLADFYVEDLYRLDPDYDMYKGYKKRNR